MANFPASLDNGTSLPNPSTSSNTNNPSHAGLHSAENAAIIAVEGKVGIGATTPAANQLLFGTGAGTTAWQGLTSAQLLAILSDETGTGSAVFATTPTLVTPKIDTINEATGGNGTTIGGVNIKSGALTTANSVVSSNITQNAVTGDKLATTAIKIGYIETTTAVGSVTTVVDWTGLSVAVTVPAGGRDVKITANGNFTHSAGGVACIINVKEGATLLRAAQFVVANTTNAFHGQTTVRVSAPSAGSHTYKMQGGFSSGTGVLYSDASGFISSLLVELI